MQRHTPTVLLCSTNKLREPPCVVRARRCLALTGEMLSASYIQENREPLPRIRDEPILGATDAVALAYTRRPRGVRARRCLAPTGEKLSAYCNQENREPLPEIRVRQIVGATDAFALAYARQPQEVRARRCLAHIFPRPQIREPPCAVGARHCLALAPWCDVVGVATLRPPSFFLLFFRRWVIVYFPIFSYFAFAPLATFVGFVSSEGEE